MDGRAGLIGKTGRRGFHLAGLPYPATPGWALREFSALLAINIALGLRPLSVDGAWQLRVRSES